MKRLYATLTLAGVVALLALIIAPFMVVTAQQAPIVSSSPVFSFADGSEVADGWSTVTRSENGVAMTLHTTDLVPNDTYTIWWVIFNAPENCSDGVCNEDDIFYVDENGLALDENGGRQLNFDAVEAAQVSVQHATGGYFGDAVNGHFSASLGLGDVPGIVFGPGLLDAQGAEVHLVVRTHGPKIDDLFDAQISTFGGACDPLNEAPCVDVQFSMHQPPAA